MVLVGLRWMDVRWVEVRWVEVSWESDLWREGAGDAFAHRGCERWQRIAQLHLELRHMWQGPH